MVLQNVLNPTESINSDCFDVIDWSLLSLFSSPPHYDTMNNNAMTIARMPVPCCVDIWLPDLVGKYSFSYNITDLAYFVRTTQSNPRQVHLQFCYPGLHSQGGAAEDVYFRISVLPHPALFLR